MVCVYIFFCSLVVVCLAVPPIITAAIKYRLFDEPSEDRRIHKKIIPNAGGVAIFIGFLFSCLVFVPFNLLPQANVLMAAGLIIFTVGLKDDIDGLSPFKKLVAQLVAAVMIAVIADIRIEHLYGFLGVHSLSYVVSIILTIFFIVSIINAFNLIDGIDGLAGLLGVVITLFYTFMFFEAGQLGYAYLSIALTGALIGFLWFNFTPAKVFMGDSGSLFIGFVVAVLSMRFMSGEIETDLANSNVPVKSVVGLVLAILSIPVLDTFSVLAIRVVKGVSPFKADNNHLHHKLLALGFNHTRAALILVTINAIFIFMALYLQFLSNSWLVAIIIFCMVVLNGTLHLLLNKHKNNLILLS